MEYGPTIYSADRQHILSDGEAAPAVLVAALLALTGGEAPSASYVAHKFDPDGTRWKAAWLSNGSLVYAAAQHELSMWTARNERPDTTRADTYAWIRPVSSIEQIGIAGIEAWASQDNPGLVCYPNWRVDLGGGGGYLNFPLFDDVPDHRRPEVDRFVDALRSEWLAK